VYHAPLNSNGTVGAWATTAALPAGMNLASAALYDGYVYVVGGQNGTGILTSVYYAQLRTDGTIGSWQTAADPAPMAFEAAAVAHNGYLYLIGGNDTVTSNPGAYHTAITPRATSQTLANAVDAAAVAITAPTGADLTCSSSQTEASQAQQDAGYSYPAGLVRMCFTTPAVNNQVSVTFVTDLKPTQVSVRHYNATTGVYSAVAGASVAQTTLSGKAALRVTYTVIDNGSLDEDGVLGAVTDPVGLAVSIAPSTGFGQPRTQALLSALLSTLGVVCIATGLSLRRAQRRSKSE
jgi:hypothetical protein